ncbi:MAG: YqgE/AlgH family protein [Betaproteobacteria bacterium]|nr:YqgE/AlgH family protein [Betaproteobacteria bacterium]
MLPVPFALLIFAAVAAFSVPAGAAERDANGVFLVAKREMRDPNFREVVVLVTQPRQGGPWGVIINRPLRHPLHEVFPEYDALKKRKDVLFFGGPVSRQGLVVLVHSPELPPGATAVLRDVFFTSDVDLIDRLLQRPDPTRGLRVYSGYSGWRPGQLQSEIARGDWHVLPADAETVFDKDPARVWPELIERASTKHTNTREIVRAGDRERDNRAPALTRSRPPVF